MHECTRVVFTCMHEHNVPVHACHTLVCVCVCVCVCLCVCVCVCVCADEHAHADVCIAMHIQR